MSTATRCEEITKAEIDAEVTRLRVTDRELYWEADRSDPSRARAIRLQFINPAASKETRKTALSDWMSRSEFLAWLKGNP